MAFLKDKIVYQALGTSGIYSW